MDRHPIHVDVAELFGDQLQHFDLVVQFDRAHPASDVAFELHTPMPGTSRVYAYHTVTLCCQHVHPQLTHTLEFDRSLGFLPRY